MFAEGALELGGEAVYAEKPRKVSKGDVILLAVDAKNGDHSCDLTDVALTITQAGGAGQVWDLATDIADNVLDGNPHADRFGNRQTGALYKDRLGPSPLWLDRLFPTLVPSSLSRGRVEQRASNPWPSNSLCKHRPADWPTSGGKSRIRIACYTTIWFRSIVSCCKASILLIPRDRERSRPLRPAERTLRPRGGTTADDDSLAAAADSVTELAARCAVSRA